MVDESKLETDDPAAESAAGGPPTVPPSAGVSVSPATEPTSPSVRVEGLAETLSRVRHELDLISHASKFDWVNKRLILLRNAVIAFSVLAALILVVTVCYREAYRQTLTIAAFDVPAQLAERGISGQVVAKALFDELVKRRDTVTTLDAGELKGAWAENRADVAIPETKFTLQAVFRYLRYLTGNEIAVDGEIILDGDDVTMKVRVLGRQPTVVAGKLADWQSQMGRLANGVLEVTQPAVLAAYLGTKAETDEEIASLSKHIVKMRNSTVAPDNAVMSVAYDAYGSALGRQGRHDDALAAFELAMKLDRNNGVAVLNAGNTHFVLRNFSEGSKLFESAQTMKLPATAKAAGLRSRVSGATTAGDCIAATQAVRDARASPFYDAGQFVSVEAVYLSQCEFEEARAIEMVKPLVILHPESGYALSLGFMYVGRPEGRFVDEAIAVSRAAIDAGVRNSAIYGNLANMLARRGDYDAAWAVRGAAEREKFSTPMGRRADVFAGYVHYLKGEFQKADDLFSAAYAKLPLREVQTIAPVAATKAGLGRFDEATVLYRKGLTMFPRSCVLFHEFGVMYEKKGDIKQALETWDEGIKAVPKCGLTYNAAARLLIKQNRIPEAKQKLDALIKIAPTSDGAVIAKELLAGMAKAG